MSDFHLPYNLRCTLCTGIKNNNNKNCFALEKYVDLRLGRVRRVTVRIILIKLKNKK